MNKSDLKIILAFILFFALLYYVQFSVPTVIGNDSYFHIKYAEYLKDNGLFSGQPFWKFSVFSEADTNVLYHFFLIPFTYFNLNYGAKLAAVVLSALVPTLIYWFLRKRKVDLAFFWSLLFFASSPLYLARASFSRGFQVGVIFLILGLDFILEKRYKHLFVLSILFAWAYSSFPLLFGACVLVVLVNLLYKKKLNYKLPLYCFLGLATGSSIHPYFPHNLSLLWIQIKVLLWPVQLLFRSLDSIPFDPWWLAITIFWFTAICFLISFLVFIRRRRFKEYASLFLLALVFLIMTFKAKRFFEYWVPFTLIGLGLISSMDIKNFIEKNKEKIKLSMPILLIILILISAPFIYLNLDKTVKIIKKDAESYPSYLFEPCALWTAGQTKRGETIFTLYSDFPPIFFFNDKNTYVYGLDPLYLWEYDPVLYEKYNDLTTMKDPNPAKTISQDFDSRFVIMKKTLPDMLKYLLSSEGIAPVFEDRYCVVLGVSK
ncbi:MAG: hypothetical protein KAT43_00355 [Nanoarchaeota archaeon]|nr:hypothetical protein [Nanoarchaeota archaeon]